MGERITLNANKGMIFTDGSTYGKTIYLSKGVSAENYYEITEEEYAKILEERNKNILNGENDYGI
jgi:hypothetical protein